MKDSGRLQAALQMMEPCSLFADIGCDHGYLSILAAEAGLCREALAADLRPGPLERARTNIRLHGLEERITAVLSDGLKKLDRKPDCVAVCGMGGLLIRDILDQGREKLSEASQLILGPHSEEQALRQSLYRDPVFAIFRETAVLDAGKYYALLDVRRRDSISFSAASCSLEGSADPNRPSGFPDSSVAGDSCFSGAAEITDLLSAYGDPELQTDLSAWRKRLVAERSRTEKALANASAGQSAAALERTETLQRQLSLLERLLRS